MQSRPVHDWLQSLQVEFCELVATQVEQARTSVHKPRGLEALEGLEQVVGQVKAGQVLIGGALLTQGLQWWDLKMVEQWLVQPILPGCVRDQGRWYWEAKLVASQRGNGLNKQLQPGLKEFRRNHQLDLWTSYWFRWFLLNLQASCSCKLNPPFGDHAGTRWRAEIYGLLRELEKGENCSWLPLFVSCTFTFLYLSVPCFLGLFTFVNYTQRLVNILPCICPVFLQQPGHTQTKS